MQEIKTPYEISVWREKEQLYSSGGVVTLVKIDLYSTLSYYGSHGNPGANSSNTHGRGAFDFYDKASTDGGRYNIFAEYKPGSWKEQNQYYIASIYTFPDYFSKDDGIFTEDWIPCFLQDGTLFGEIPNIANLQISPYKTENGTKMVISDWDNIVYLKTDIFNNFEKNSFKLSTDNSKTYMAYSPVLSNYLQTPYITEILTDNNSNSTLEDINLIKVKKINYTNTSDGFSNISLRVEPNSKNRFRAVFSPFDIFPEINKDIETCYLKIETKVKYFGDDPKKAPKCVLYNNGVKSFQTISLKGVSTSDKSEEIKNNKGRTIGIKYGNKAFVDNYCADSISIGSTPKKITFDFTKERGPLYKNNLYKSCAIIPINKTKTLQLMNEKKHGLVFNIEISDNCDLSFRISLGINFNKLYSESEINFNDLFNKKRDGFGYSVPAFKYFDEQRVVIIGSNEMTGQNRAFNPKFTQSINGISTLNFSMYTNYWDDQKQDYVKNSFIDFLINETKIKLKKDNNWYDFIIKSKEEDSEQNMITYTCKDYHATTLSKQGYNTELSKELYNNQGTVEELADTVLKDSDWKQNKSKITGTEIILEKQEETLYKLQLYSDVIYGNTTVQAHRPFYDKKGKLLGRIGIAYGTQANIDAGVKEDYDNGLLALRPAATIYIHYSDLIKEWESGDLIPCYIHLESDQYVLPLENYQNWIKTTCMDVQKLKKDDNNVIDDQSNLVYFKYDKVRDPKSCIGNYTRPKDENGVLQGIYERDCTYNSPGSFSTREVSMYRSKKITYTNMSKYIPDIEEYVNIYEKDGKEYYSYTDTEYITADLVSELAVNGGSENGEEGILSDSGWMSSDYTKRSLEFASNLSLSDDTNLKNYVTGSNGSKYATAAKGFINVACKDSTTEMHIYNSAINSNKELIGTFTEGDEYILELEVNTGASIGITGENSITPKVEIHEINYTDTGFGWEAYPISKYLTTARWYTANTEDKTIDGRRVALLTYHIKIIKSVTEADFKARDYGLHIYSNTTGNYDFRIYRASFYKKVDIEKDGKKYIIGPDFYLKEHPSNWREVTPSGPTYTLEKPKDISKFLFPENGETATSPSSEAKIKYHIYDAEQNDDISSKEDIVLAYKGYNTPESLGYIAKETDNKIRNIEISKSNTFNILQSLSETFGCWVRFEVEHEKDGRIKLAYPPTHQEKYVSFHNFIGQPNPIKFTKTTNTKKIQRTVETDNFVTKLIVPDNINQYAKNGICSISRAKDNVSKDNIIYDLSYYIQMNLLPESTNEDLALFLEKMGNQAILLESYVEQLNAEETAKISAEKEYTVWSELVISSNEELAKLKVDFQKTYGVTIEALKSSQTGDDDWKKVYDASGKILDAAKTDIVNILTLESKLGKNSAVLGEDETGYYLEEKKAKNLLEEKKKNIKAINLNLNLISENRKKTYREFAQKYNLFLQEGTWNSANYLDDNLYYLDAREILADSAKPQVSYSISAVDLSGIKEYENYSFKIGDRTTIEDPEFFGWVLKARGNIYEQTPYQEEVVVSEVSQSLDDASQNTFTVQNYRTQFEDLFQKMSAQTQTLQFKEGSYDNAANAVGNDGQILPDAITNTFNNASFQISNASDQSLTWGNQGIIITNQLNKSQKIKIGGGQISISNDGGAKWTTTLTGNGINANVITTGELNTNIVHIKNGDNNSFVWNKDGLNAYLYDNGKYSLNDKITFDQYGLYGGLATNTNLSITFLNKLNEIHKNSRFALTWKGFSLKTGHVNSTGYVSIDSDNDITLNVKPTGSSNYLKIIQIGHLESTASTSASDASESVEPTSQSSESGHYGIRVKDMTGNVILETTEEHVNGRFHINCGKWS